MRILHVIPSVAVSDGGPSRAMIAIERALTSAGIAVVTATTDHRLKRSGSITEEEDISVGIITRFYARKRTDFYKVAPALVPWLWENVRNFDTVHIHALFSFSSVVAALIAHARGVPYIIRPLGTLTAYGMTRRALLKRASFMLIEARLLRNAAAVHFTSHEEWEEARSLNVSMRGVVIPLGVEDQEPGNGDRLETEYPSLVGRNAILFLSRLDPKKNLEAMLDAFAKINSAFPSTSLLVAGAGSDDYVIKLKRRAETLNLGGRVIWFGHVEGQRKQDLLARADIFVLPSFSENFGIAAVEAMLAGLPCVLGRGVAVAPKAAAEGAAIAVEPQPDLVAFALSRLLGDKVVREQMGVKARAHALQHYSSNAMAMALEELYASLLRTAKGKVA